jgi:hypothetical protein
MSSDKPKKTDTAPPGAYLAVTNEAASLALSMSAALVPPDTNDDTSYSQDVAVMKRVRWFSQLNEFDDQYYRLLVDQQMFQDRDRRHNLGLHQRGVVVGLEVQYSGTGLSFTVTPGYAIDPDGFSLLRSPTTNVPPDRETSFTGSGLKSGESGYLCICPSLAKADELSFQGNTDYSTWWDRPRVVLVSKQDLDWAQKADVQRRTQQARLLKPSELGPNGMYQSNPGRILAYNAVVLAKVTRTASSTLEFDYSERQCSGVIVPNSPGMGSDHPSPPAALCFEPNEDGTGGKNVFTGDLTIDGKLIAAGGLELGANKIASANITYTPGSVPGSAVDMSSARSLPAGQLTGTLAAGVAVPAAQLTGTLAAGVAVPAAQLTGTLAAGVVVPAGQLTGTLAGQIIDWSAAGKTIPNSALKDPPAPVEGRVTVNKDWQDFSAGSDNKAPIRLWQDPVSRQTQISGAVVSKGQITSGFQTLLTVPEGFRPAKETIGYGPLFDDDTNTFILMATLLIQPDGRFLVTLDPEQLNKPGFPKPVGRFVLSGVQWLSKS